MISAPSTGCSATRRPSNLSAGGQLEQPSEVNSSTSTGTRSEAAAPQTVGVPENASNAIRVDENRDDRRMNDSGSQMPGTRSGFKSVSGQGALLDEKRRFPPAPAQRPSGHVTFRSPI